ncbi:MAG TPA: polyphenol oxidase family protein [Solirubrobacteraceae bacterium]|nr:polyphenol oxidase family protein [Solirubrobacteraceae bacterium]
MVVPAPFRELGGQFTIELLGARAAFTTRRGGVSEGPYASLNLGFGTADDPARQDANRARLRELVGAPPAVWMYQVHSDRVAVLDDHAVLADPAARAERPEVDGRATRLPGVALGALGADCLTVAVAGGGAVATAHAGWRGLAAGVLGRAVDRVRALADSGAELEAAIGPGAGPCCYEVGPEVHAAFADRPEAHRGDNLDMTAVAAAQLSEAGVAAVHALRLCTICHPELFFSHRRDRGVTGRQAGLAWLT